MQQQKASLNYADSDLLVFVLNLKLILNYIVAHLEYILKLKCNIVNVNTPFSIPEYAEPIQK